MSQNNSETTKQFYMLYEEAKKQAQLHPSAEQIIAVKTAKGNTYTFPNYTMLTTHEDEGRFVRMLQDRQDAQVRHLVCLMMPGREIEISSFFLRNALLHADPKNEETTMLLQADIGLMVKTIKWSMPPKREQ